MKPYSFARAICVNGAWGRECVRRLDGASVKVASVIGFLGAMSTTAKAAEAELVLGDGAAELDMVIILARPAPGTDGSGRSGPRREAAGGTPVKAILRVRSLVLSWSKPAARHCNGARFQGDRLSFCGGATVALSPRCDRL
jgi:deoxyribose-phosphate aldolase